MNIEHEERGPSAPRGWPILFLDGALIFFTALLWLLHGRFYDTDFERLIAGSSWDAALSLLPNVARLMEALVRLFGCMGLLASVFIMGVAVTGYRKAESWAWYVMWAIPSFAVLDASVLLAYDALRFRSAFWDGVLFLTAVVSQVASADSFARSERSNDVVTSEAS